MAVLVAGDSRADTFHYTRRRADGKGMDVADGWRRRFFRGLSRRLAGDEPLVFTPPDGETYPALSSAGLYVHVPFCRSLCPYCPYVRFAYDPAAAERYIDAVIREIRARAGAHPDLDVTSVYFGGGTPTVLGDGLDRIVHALREAFPRHRNWCVETNPSDLGDATLARLRRLGFDAVSVGVQTFSADRLRALGRAYDPAAAREALACATAAGFGTVNVDLMFALPAQTEVDFAADLDAVLEHPVTQVTAYPLFTFPYTEVGRHLRQRSLRLPPFAARRRMYYLFYDTMTERGFARTGVWSFTRGGRYSSVTRERYLGFGPSAASYYETDFTLNTFDPDAYAEAVAARGTATALAAKFPPGRRKLFDFYWRLYDTVLPDRRDLATLSYAPGEEKPFARWLRWGRRFGWLDRGNGEHRLTRRGTFWAHWLQNHYALDRLASLWAVGRNHAWPGRIEL